jgi:hypothetical protein
MDGEGVLDLALDCLPSCGSRSPYSGHLRLQQDHLGLFVGSSAMLDTAGHYDKLAGPQLDHPVRELDAKAARHTRNISSASWWWCHGNVP